MNKPTIEIKVENAKGIIKHYEMMLSVAKTEVQKEFYQKQIKLHKALIEEKSPALNKTDKKTLEATAKDLALWNNKIYKIEIDQENNQIKVISKRKAAKGKGFIVPLFEELKHISMEHLEKYIYSKYTTEVFMYL